MGSIPSRSQIFSSRNFGRARILGQARAQGQIEEDGYEMMFVYAGLAPDQISMLLPALSKVIKYSMIEEQSTIDVLTAKKSYENLLKSILSPDQLEAYNQLKTAPCFQRNRGNNGL
ncbi:MAG: hypothetical protein KIT22_01520 [Verrucomicrobiae bacterium]|nr:hypothetical protein [Verrucomicrobiae bacterium]